MVNLSILVLLTIGLVVFILNMTIESKIREEIRLKLLDKRVKKILINDKEFDIELSVVVKEFSKIGKESIIRGSMKTNKFKVDIISDDSTYSFKLFRNSNEITKYQVKTDKYNYELEVGMIKTNLLDEMK